MATFSRRYRRPWRPASQLPPTAEQIKQVRQLYSSDAFTQKERDDLAEWLASGEATRQGISSTIVVAKARKEAYDEQHAPDGASQPPAIAAEANPYMNTIRRCWKTPATPCGRNRGGVMTDQQHNDGLDTKGLTALFPASAIQWRAGATNKPRQPD